MKTRMLNRAARSPPLSPVKPPERCPYCGSPKIAAKGRRLKKLETIRIYQCKACDRRFTPGPRAVDNSMRPAARFTAARNEAAYTTAATR